MTTKDKIIEILKNKINVEKINVYDEGFLHVGHNEAKKSGGGHYKIEIVSDDFEGKTLIERHRIVNDLLFRELKGLIHALAIKTKTVNEAKG